ALALLAHDPERRARRALGRLLRVHGGGILDEGAGGLPAAGGGTRLGPRQPPRRGLAPAPAPPWARPPRRARRAVVALCPPGRHVRRRRRVAPAAAALLPPARAAGGAPDRLVAGERRPQAPRGGPHALAGVRRARPAPRRSHGRHAARERAVAPGRRGLAAGL